MPLLKDPHDLRIRNLIVKDSSEVTIVGVPFDGAVAGRPGARFAPEVIRNFLYSYTPICYGVDLRNLAIGDVGDIDIDRESIENTWKSIGNSIFELLNKCERLIILGGDHSITFPAVKAFERKFGKIGLIYIDAHLDLRELPAGQLSSGITVHKILQECKINPENIVYIGVREWVNAPYYLDKAKKLGITVFTTDITADRIDEITQQAYNIASFNTNAVYISFDVDVLDVAFGPGVNATSSGGLTPREIFRMMRILGNQPKVIAIDFVELCPPYDVANVTAQIVATSILYFLAGYSKLKELRETTQHKT